MRRRGDKEGGSGTSARRIGLAKKGEIASIYTASFHARSSRRNEEIESEQGTTLRFTNTRYSRSEHEAALSVRDFNFHFSNLVLFHVHYDSDDDDDDLERHQVEIIKSIAHSLR